ncbi:hypothetical protein BCR32DRAFT_202345 [Anaeromyces robustus]|uniref:C2H2-type domain-containing protein n=1 Tax=Anaeromyces robustus TaxID=1754192 RepID=A0A1Y1XAV4_9FUNG|nr:hypothetical protein BCR32DRAFT_202345 [Anaeromyces robustus]|eukprot:ORX82882.1 hypothetical protein BCR32DRAFT_202345 [Anaeromyces robustus]
MIQNDSISNYNDKNEKAKKNKNHRKRDKVRRQKSKDNSKIKIEENKNDISKATQDPEGISNSNSEEEEEAANLLSQNQSIINLPLQPILVLCPFKDCEQESSPFMNPNDLQSHLGLIHNINISNIEHVIPFIEKYLNYWIDKIEKSENKIENFANIYSIPNKNYQKEDISIRQDLQREKLNEMLIIQDRERKDNNKPRKCLFCKKIINERINYFQHMFDEHNFNIGLPDNIVNIDEFLYILQTKLNNLQCLYCEKIFKSNAVLRKHMRKKKHFKINSKNHIYDKFYIINYLEPGKNWENYVNDKYESDDEKDDEWDDWDEEIENEPTMCLFDEFVADSIEEALNHMKNKHHFDFYDIQKKNGLDFYQCIMLINYIRRQTSLFKCFSCHEDFDSIEELGNHLKEKNHYTAIPPKDAENSWNDVKYMLPTYDDDPLLHGFDEFFDDLEDTEQKDISTQYVTAEKLSIDDRLKEKQIQERNSKINNKNNTNK